MFWEPFYHDCEANFYTDHEKEYFIFTDSEKLNRIGNDRIHPFFQRKSGWPYDTLLRFHWFSAIQDKLKCFDFCYYFNANTAIEKDINENLIPFPTNENPLIFWCHTRHEYDYTGEGFNPERNPKSNAYVPEGTPCRCYGGGFFGGTGEAFVKMCIELRDAIQQDLNEGIIAIWHDQSHIIKYAIDKPHLEVPMGLVSEEEYIKDRKKCVMYFIAKSNYGGNDALRETGGVVKKIKNGPRSLYKKLLKKTEGNKFNSFLRKTVKLFKRGKK